MSLHYNNEVKANESTSKLKEEREVVLVLACHPSNTTLTHSLSFTLMAKTKTWRRKKLKQLQTKQQFKSKLWISPTEPPGGVFIGTRGKGPGGQPLARSPGARAPIGPRFRGPGRAARAQLRAVRRPICCLTPECLGLLTWCPGLTKSSL